MKGFCSTISSLQCIEPKAIKPIINNKSVWYSKLAVGKALHANKKKISAYLAR